MTSGAARRQRDELFFEDMPEGFAFAAGPLLVTRDDIVGFAAAFDPQPFHLDEAAGRASRLGGLAASGWHTAALQMRMIYDALLWRVASLGAPGIDDLRWLKPVRPGDSLTMQARVTAARVSASRPERGIVTLALALHNQDGAVVMTQANSILVRRRSPP